MDKCVRVYFHHYFNSSKVCLGWEIIWLDYGEWNERPTHFIARHNLHLYVMWFDTVTTVTHQETAYSLISFCCEFQRAVKSRLHRQQTVSMTLFICLSRRRKNPILSLLLLAVLNSGSFLTDRYWLSGRQHAREKEMGWGGGWRWKLRKRNQQYWKTKNGDETEFRGSGTNKCNGRNTKAEGRKRNC